MRPWKTARSVQQTCNFLDRALNGITRDRLVSIISSSRDYRGRREFLVLQHDLADIGVERIEIGAFDRRETSVSRIIPKLKAISQAFMLVSVDETHELGQARLAMGEVGPPTPNQSRPNFIRPWSAMGSG
jgi:hypothetical protein